MSKQFCVYIMTNVSNRVLYTGVTSNLPQRIEQHKDGAVKGFTKKYNVKKLVYAEPCPSARSALEREKQIKAGSRQKKIDLVNSINPDWRDLSESL